VSSCQTLQYSDMIHSRRRLKLVAKRAPDASRMHHSRIHRRSAPYTPSTIRKRIFDNNGFFRLFEPSHLSNLRPKPRHNGQVRPAFRKLAWRLTKCHETLRRVLCVNLLFSLFRITALSPLAPIITSNAMVALSLILFSRRGTLLNTGRRSTM
jgi:hypothetical protein